MSCKNNDFYKKSLFFDQKFSVNGKLYLLNHLKTDEAKPTKMAYHHPLCALALVLAEMLA